ncbi:hypothetical protein BKA65DRAFT_143050 [Rhexocercosporidium sp. MPI-PUGE-AT-0058]|nr:hypothetical protein BKA65DRAFT_143050 [Rhexocercosporidium sp. MPI-PUGE-AT-0058]
MDFELTLSLFKPGLEPDFSERSEQRECPRDFSCSSPHRFSVSQQQSINSSVPFLIYLLCVMAAPSTARCPIVRFLSSSFIASCFFKFMIWGRQQHSSESSHIPRKKPHCRPSSAHSAGKPSFFSLPPSTSIRAGSEAGQDRVLQLLGKSSRPSSAALCASLDFRCTDNDLGGHQTMNLGILHSLWFRFPSFVRLHCSRAFSRLWLNP